VTLIEILSLNLGGAVIKATAKLWFRDNVFAASAADGISKLFELKFKDYTDRRAAERLFSSLQDEVAQSLADVIQAEFPRLGDGDREAAVMAVSDVFARLSLERQLFDADLDAARLETIALSHSETPFLGLSAEALALAQLLLRECCNYVVRVAGRLPDFARAGAQEMLKREREIGDDIKLVLKEIAALRAQQERSGADQRQAFEERYRNALSERLDRLELFGLRLVGAGARTYRLTVAYVTLTASAEGRLQSGRVDTVLSGAQRVLVRGEAGSGKTTLLQWLAVRAAQRDFQGALAAWNSRIPFFIRLRDFTNRELPPPERFLDGTAKTLVQLMQDPAWVHRVLEDGRGLVLVDGVDELPASRRSELCAWLSELGQSFPRSVFVLSSRPAAIDAEPAEALPRRTLRAYAGSLREELTELKFAPVTLEGMSLSDSEALVEQWHAAVAKDLSGEETLAKLERDQRDLRQTLRSRPAVRSLATNPLLCAMICALNWERQQRLPDDRMDLYAIALDLLLDARDAERAVASKLQLKDKRELLDTLAYWMLRNGYSEVSRGQALEQIGNALPRLAKIELGAEAVLQELLERSGVLRQPQHDLVDFIHRTFLEYMAAQAAVRAGDIGLLVKQAREESWRETVVFAAGHAQGKARDELIRELVKKRFFIDPPLETMITAVCCLETVGRSLDPALLTELERLANGLFPPRDFASALLLAPAAALNPNLLAGHTRESSSVITACVRCASLVGGARMLEIIAEYAQRVPESSIDSELANAWDSFDDLEYAERVIRPRGRFFGVSTAELDEESLTCLGLLVTSGRKWDSGDIAQALQIFSENRGLALGRRVSKEGPLASSLGEPQNAVSESEAATSLGRVDARRLMRLRSLQSLALQDPTNDVLESLSTLQSLWFLIISAMQPVRLDPLPSLPQLRSLSLDGQVLDLRPLAQCTQLQSLDLDNCALSELSLLELSPSVVSLKLSQLPIASLAPLARWVQLEKLHLSYLSLRVQWDWLVQLERLHSLSLTYLPGTELIPYERMVGLESLMLTELPALAFEGLVLAPHLKEFSAAVYAAKFGRLPVDPKPTPLREVRITQLPRSVEQISLFGMDCVYLRSTAGYTALRRLELHSVGSLAGAEALLEFPSLQELVIRKSEVFRDAASASYALPANLRRQLEARGVIVTVKD